MGTRPELRARVRVQRRVRRGHVAVQGRGRGKGRHMSALRMLVRCVETRPVHKRWEGVIGGGYCGPARPAPTARWPSQVRRERTSTRGRVARARTDPAAPSTSQMEERLAMKASLRWGGRKGAGRWEGSRVIMHPAVAHEAQPRLGT